MNLKLKKIKKLRDALAASGAYLRGIIIPGLGTKTALFLIVITDGFEKFETSGQLCSYVDGNWTKPEIAPFSGKYSDADPYFSPSGESVYFISTRPIAIETTKADFDIWRVSHNKGTFGEAQHLGKVVNSTRDELYPAVAANGNLYFSTEDGETGYDIMIAEFKNDTFSEPKSLKGSINTANIEFDSFIAPDESYLVYTGMGYSDSRGSGDLYISRNENGAWTTGRNLGDSINTEHMEQCPVISWDGGYLFFTSFRDSQPYIYERPMETREYLGILNSPLNGLGNIFWVKWDSTLKN